MYEKMQIKLTDVLSKSVFQQAGIINEVLADYKQSS
jgi:hypothetical protein